MAQHVKPWTRQTGGSLSFAMTGSGSVEPFDPGSGPTVSWTANPSAGGFRVYYGTDPEAPEEVKSVAAGATSTVVTGLDPGTYYFWVVSVDEDGNESNTSSRVSTVVA